MPIEFKCQCGKTLSVPDEVAGHKAKCPSCGAVLTVPGTPPPDPDQAPPANKVDAMVESVREDIARSRERAPELTTIAIGLGAWSGIYLILTLIHAAGSDYGNWVLFLFVCLPIAAYGGLAAYSMIIAHRLTVACIELIAPIIFGINYALFWFYIQFAQGMNVVLMILTLVNLGTYAFLYLYFRKPEVKALFVPAEAAEADVETPQP